MATELAQAYVTIIPSLKGAQRTIASELSGVNTSKVGKSWGSGISCGFNPSIKGIAKAATGILAGIGSAKILQGGISRALKLDQAENKFKTMGINVEEAMKSCTESVKGTAFGLDAAATVAASLGVSGVQAGDEMTRSLKAVAGMASLGGVEMERVGAVFGKVAAQGKIQGDELMQLSEMGVPALQMLSKHLGLTTAEVQKMVSSGEVDFQTFSDAMYEAFGEAAQGANDTFQGAMSNVTAAISRVTAAFASPALEGLRKVFVALIPAIDAVGKLLDPLVKKFEKFVEFASGKAVAGIDAFIKAISDGGPISNFASWLGETIHMFSIGANPIEGFKLALNRVKNTIDGLTSGGQLSAFIDGIKEKIATLPQPVQNVINAFMGFGEKVASVFSNMNIGGAAAAAGFGLILTMFGGPLSSAATAIVGFGSKIVGFGSTIVGVFDTISGYGGVLAMLSSKVSTFHSAVALCGGGFKGLATALGLLSNPVGLVVAAIAVLGAAFVYLMSTNESFRLSIMSLVTNIAASLAPIIQIVGQAIGDLASNVLPLITNAVALIIPVIGQVITILFQLVAAIAPVVTTIIGTVVPIISSLIQIVVSVASAIIAAVVPVISTILAVIQAAMPIIQSIITTVCTVILGIVQLVWPIVQSVITIAAQAVLKVIQIVMPIIQSIIGTVMPAILSIIYAVWPIIQAVIENANYIIQGVIETVWPVIQGIIEGVMDFIQGLIEAGTAVMEGDWSKAWDIMSNALSDAMSSILSGIQDGISNAMGFIGELPGKIQGVFSGAASWLVSAGADILNGLKSGIEGAIQGVINSITGAVSEIIQAGKDALGIASPSKVFAEIGDYTMQGLALGLENDVPYLVSTIGSVTDAMTDNFALEPFGDINPTIRTWSRSEIVSSAQRDDERSAKMEKALTALGDRIENMKVMLDSGELVGATASKYDRALSRRQMMAERGF